MASKSSPTAPGGPTPLSELRVVLLGKAGAGKSKVARLLLGGKDLKEACDRCVLHENKHAGRRIWVVDTPGWDRYSIHNTSENIKEEIIRSASLCPTGPHALILVLPVDKLTDAHSADELKSAQQHMELLSERVWKHTMVLFLCDGEVEETTVTKHIDNAKNLLEKCGNGHYVLQNMGSETQVHEFLKKIENLVDNNDYFPPQTYFDMIQSKTPQPEDTEVKGDKKHSEEHSQEKTELRHRRGSYPINRPNLNEEKGTSGNQTEGGEATKHQNQDDFYALLWNCLPPATVILFVIIGALIGSVAGAAYGPLGSGAGIVFGVVLSVLISILLIYALNLARWRTT
ncbi:GTPase IMAP family member 7-like [Colossoma macropomum]|uniref:GTPase IMAP family member 7-like n=1 Tax=Colossoma macropomum TaxID=42526 RepID=UPI0018647D53|nr:GTPase IMAP family member 7-like [Colossoma macropomum]